jgi:hypothetical protein
MKKFIFPTLVVVTLLTVLIGNNWGVATTPETNLKSINIDAGTIQAEVTSIDGDKTYRNNEELLAEIHNLKLKVNSLSITNEKLAKLLEEQGGIEAESAARIDEDNFLLTQNPSYLRLSSQMSEILDETPDEYKDLIQNGSPDLHSRLIDFHGKQSYEDNQWSQSAKTEISSFLNSHSLYDDIERLNCNNRSCELMISHESTPYDEVDELSEAIGNYQDQSVTVFEKTFQSTKTHDGKEDTFLFFDRALEFDDEAN